MLPVVSPADKSVDGNLSFHTDPLPPNSLLLTSIFFNFCYCKGRNTNFSQLSARLPRMKTTPVSSVKLSSHQLLSLYDAFLKELRKNPSKSGETRGTYERALREFFRWLKIDGSLSGASRFLFRIKDVERYKSYLTKRKKLSPVSVSTYLTALRQFCNHLINAGILDENPAKHVKGNKRPSVHSRETVTFHDIQMILQAIDRSDERGFRDFAIIKAMIGCGLSEIELIRANIGDVKNVSATIVLYVQGKGMRTKETGVILPQDVKEALQGYLAFRKDADENEPLFMSAGNRTRGKRMTTRGIRERVNMYLEKAGVKNGKARRITPFSLRHTAASIMAQNGASAEEIQSRFRIGTITTAMMYLKDNE
jgi:integrase/recombinase XerC